MKRYSTTRHRLDKSGIRVYGTTYYPEIPVSDNDQFIYPQDGDRVDTKWLPGLLTHPLTTSGIPFCKLFTCHGCLISSFCSDIPRI